MVAITSTLPLLLPGAVLTLVLSVVGSAAVGRWLGVRRSVSLVLLLMTGLILAGTLSPLDLMGEYAYGIPGSCDLGGMWLASPSDVQSGYDVAGNIVIFIPFGVAIGMAPMSPRKVALFAGAVALPFAIEATQLLVTPLGRSCQGADVINNLTGLLIGLAAGAVLVRLVPATRRPADPG